MIHHLRQQQRRIAAGLWLTLLFSWLSLFCAPCMAMPVTDVHDRALATAAQATGVVSHDCCKSKPAAPQPCTDCDELSAMLPVLPESLSVLSSEPATAPQSSNSVQVAWSAVMSSADVNVRLFAVDVPIYLRDCSFLI